MKYHHTMQDLSSDCGLAVVKSVLLTYGKYNSTSFSGQIQNFNINQGLSLLDIEELLAHFGIFGSNYQVDDFSYLNFETPTILVTKRDGINHYILVYGRHGNKLIVSNPDESKLLYQSAEDIENTFKGYAYIVEENVPRVISQENNKEGTLGFRDKANLFLLSSLLWLIPLFIIFSIQYLVVYQSRNMALPQIFLATIIYLLLIIIFFIDKLRLDDLGQKITFNNRLIQVNNFMGGINNKKIDRQHNIYNDLIKFWNNFYAANNNVKILTIKYDLFYMGILFCLIFVLNPLISFFTLGIFLIYLTVFMFTRNQRRNVNRDYLSKIGELSNFIEEFMHNKIDRLVFSNRSEVDSYSLNLLKKIDTADKNQKAESTKVLGIYDMLIYLELIIIFTYILFSVYFSVKLSVTTSLICFVLVYIMFNLARPSIHKLLDIEKYSLNKTGGYQDEIVNGSSSESAPLIETVALNNVSFIYDDSDNDIIKNFSALFENNQLSIIKGQNGSGKTTLLHLLMGIERPSAGEIKYLDKGKVYNVNQFNLLKQVSYYSSDEYLNYTSIERNIRYNIYNDDFKNKIENYFNLPLDKVIFYNGENLSLGEGQKVLLTRCLNKKANIYIFDEPTTNLDTDSKDKFYHLVKSLKDKAMVIIVAHDNQFDRLANQIIELN
ncbi:ATP-binding cassette domain-containing protein [Streptococcus troglodytae]